MLIINVGAKVTQLPISISWRRRPSRSTELGYRLVDLRDDEAGIHSLRYISGK